MGLLKHLLFWPVTGPTFLTEFAIGKVDEVARRELTDDTPIKAELLELQMALEMDEIDEATYLEREAELVARLREVRRWREQFGMPTSGGPVRVAQDEDESSSAGAEEEERGSSDDA
ncbi:MAG TPA: gas vesicle protein GvpG [Gemmatimonadaceae bacterium]|nr:gas vesicle protein GvpG [Gemmatimonadaceae bacterium]